LSGYLIVIILTTFSSNHSCSTASLHPSPPVGGYGCRRKLRWSKGRNGTMVSGHQGVKAL